MQGAVPAALRVGSCALAAAISLTQASALQRCGEASWYAHEGLPTASGGVADPTTLTAAHRTLAFGTKVLVENLDNGRSVVVRIDDRGPFVDGRIIDVSRAGAKELGFKKDGVARVRITPVETKLRHASDERCQ